MILIHKETAEIWLLYLIGIYHDVSSEHTDYKYTIYNPTIPIEALCPPELFDGQFIADNFELLGWL